MRRKIPSLQSLAVFDAAARHQSYTRAAQELALTQSAVSRQIAALEEFLGVPLFRRTRHGVLITEAGQQYARQIAPRLQALERDTLDAMSGHASGGSGGTVTLAAVPTFAARWLVPRLKSFTDQHPDIVLHVETRTRPFLFSDTAFDAALFALTPAQMDQWAGTVGTPLMPEVVVPVCAPEILQNINKTGTSLDAMALAQLPLLQQSTRPEAWRDWFAAAGLSDPTDLPNLLAGPRFEQFSMTSAAAVAGMGLALVPQVLIEDELARGALVVAHRLSLPGERFFYLVQPQQKDAKPATQVFTTWLLRLSPYL
jgi:LysR family glycine cleavage system transcriptional activator